MKRQHCNALQNFDDSNTDILKKRLLKTTNIAAAANLQQNVLLKSFRAPTTSSMIVSSVQAPQSSMPITHGLVTHSLAPVKIHTNNPAYPLQLSTVHVPVQIPGSTSNINVPVHLSGSRNIPLQLTGPTVSLPIQVSSTTTVPVQLTSGDTISVPLQLPAGSQNIQLSGHPGMPLLQNTSQSLHGSIFQVHMGTNQRPTTMEGVPEMGVPTSTQLQITDSNGMQVKMNNPNPNTLVQIPNSSSNSIQLTLPSSANAGAVQLRGARPVPHVVYIQTPQGLKPVTSSDMITQASSSGNPPQIIVRRPVSSSGNIQIISNMNHKTNIAPKMSVQNKSLLAHGSVSQPIVIQKPKDKKMVPVSIAAGGANKQAIAYLAPVKKNKSKSAEQSILISNNQNNVSSTSANQKLFLTPMNMPKIQNTKFILPVTLPASMASKGPVINFQIANGQIQNDPQGNITVMRDTASMETTEMPPLQPLAKNPNGRENPGSVPQSPKSDKSFTIPGSIPGSRAEPTGEQEYSLSIPDNASMNDDIYTVSIADEDGAQRVNSFTLSSMQEKGKSLISKHAMDRNDTPSSVQGAAILRRSNSDNSERKTANENLKRRISLCNENLSNKIFKHDIAHKSATEKCDEEPDNNDDHRVPSLFCDEKLDLDAKPAAGDSEPEDYKISRNEPTSESSAQQYLQYSKTSENYLKREKLKRDSVDSVLEDDPPGLMWSNGVAILRGSILQFQTNEFGLIDLIDHNKKESCMILSAKYQTPLKQRIDHSGREKKPTSPEDLYRCDGCGCHGMAAEFITPNFCSVTCQNEMQKITQRQRDRERIEAKKHRNKMRKLAGGLNMRKQLSDTDTLEHADKVPLKQYDSLPSDARLTESADDFIENEKYPWMCGKNGFSWMRYLEFCKAKAAPTKLFKDPFPYSRNSFKLNNRLEAIDPQHPSYFCVVSVAEMQGYRLRLHFDDYPDMYDFWVNADSVDIYPAGWSERNGRHLKPPGSMQSSVFSWPIYLKQVRAVAAPRQCFVHLGHMQLKPIGFRIGMKLEAEDRKNNLVCVATIADIMDHRMLINFDSWDEMYDYWVDATSPYIHAVGWAEENGIALTPPNYYKESDSFSWESYLNETNATAAPARAFKTRPPAGFKTGMKLEVVDQRVPFLIRVATISEVKGHQLRVSFDGWPDELSHWLDDDSPDIHPVGWCLKTGHPLEPPLTSEELSAPGPCGYFGCRGLGSLRGGAHKKHGAASACPYVPRAPASPPDRLAPARAERALPLPRRVLGRPSKLHASTPTSDTPSERRGRPPKHKRVEAVAKAGSDEESISSGGARPAPPAPAPAPQVPAAAAAVRAHVLRDAGAGAGAGGEARGPQPDVRALARGLPARAVDWTQADVVTFVSRLCGAVAGGVLRAARLGGRELLMCSREELVACARLRLGPAIKLHAAVRRLRDEHAAT